MIFLKLSNADVSFGKKTLMWKTYTTNEALPNTKQVQIVDPKEFVIVALNADSKTFVVHVAIQKREKMPVHSKKQAEIGAQLFDKALTAVPTKYFNYSNVFLVENAVKFPENIVMNEYIIKLEEDKPPPFGAIYSLGPVELEMLKTYIKTNLANSFIRLFKSPAGALIFFDRKPDRNLCLCIDYRDLNNIPSKTNICCFWLVSH